MDSVKGTQGIPGYLRKNPSADAFILWLVLTEPLPGQDWLCPEARGTSCSTPSPTHHRNTEHHPALKSCVCWWVSDPSPRRQHMAGTNMNRH